MSPAAKKRRKLARTPYLKPKLRAQLVARHGRSCWLCNRAIALADTLSIDHVRPLSRGGSNKIDNLRLSHERCNRKRGDGPVPELLLTADMIHTRPERAAKAT